MIPLYSLTPRARRDMDEIVDYTITHWGKRRAKSYVLEIQSALEAVGENPNLGRSCVYVGEGYKKYPVGSHILFYRVIANIVSVVRILHQRMDVGRHFS